MRFLTAPWRRRGPASDTPEGSGPPSKPWLRLALLAGVLSLCFVMRQHANRQLPFDQRHNYPQCYEYSLSFVGGQGLRALHLIDGPGISAKPSGDQRAAEPLRDFLRGRRASLSRDELDAYLQSVSAPGLPPRDGVENQFVSTRILDVYAAAFVWQWFGMSWHSLYTFYSLVETMCCLLVFLIARRLAGSPWAGLVAAGLYALSPLEIVLSTFSLRDTSPLWFAVLGFYLLICVADRFRWAPANRLSCLGLGLAATIGLGYRYDAAMLPPVLAAGLLVLLLARRREGTRVLGGMVLFGLGAFTGFVGINALCGFQRMTSDAGYHMAFYGENTRCNLFDLENSFQIDWCDQNTFREARRLTYVAKGNADTLLVYDSPEHFAKCKEMWAAVLRYNAFAWVRYFPEFCWQALHGLGAPGSVQGVEHARLPWAVPWWLQFLHGIVLVRLWDLLPAFFLLGVATALTARSEALASLSLLAFAGYFAAVLLVVLPMTKHLALMVLPLHVFGGIGLWAAACLCRPATWRRGLVPLVRSRRLWWTLGGGTAAAAVWGGACLVAYDLSVAERTGYLRDALQLAARGVPAPETLKGKQRFTVRLLPRPEDSQCGYLLTIRAGSQAGPLVCRHVRHPIGPIGTKVYWTNHRLLPDRTQYFFVSCCQGALYGEARPYVCTVSVDGDAEIVASKRVDLSGWQRLSLSTVFVENERQPGSPRVPAPSAEWRYSIMPVLGYPTVAAANPARATHRPAPTLHHLVTRNPQNGQVYFAFSDGRRFEVATLTPWDAALAWTEPLTGDFDGDGLVDVVGCERDGGYLWVSLFRGDEMANACWGQWPAFQDLVDLGVGDFNGDGLDDVFARNRRTGSLYVARSTSKGFDVRRWGEWPPAVDWQYLHVGDFNGDGKSDVAGYDPATGQWQVALSSGDHFETRAWGAWPAGVRWQHVCVGDFDGDGTSDLAGWDPQSGQWWVALSRGDHFDCRPFGHTDTGDPWQDVAAGDVDGDGRDDLVGWSGKTGQCWVALATGAGFEARAFGVPPCVPRGLCVADFDGDGRADVAWRDPASGGLWVGRSHGNAFQFESWGRGPAGERFTPLRACSPWP